MQRIHTTQASTSVGQSVEVRGWIHNIRELGGLTFLVIRDGWGTLQAVVEHGDDEGDVELDAGLESVVRLAGEILEEERAPEGVELAVENFEVETSVNEQPPVQLSLPDPKAKLPTQLDHATVALRHPKRRAIFRLSAGVMAGFRQTLRGRGFTEIQTPKIVASATESGANVFELDYFGKEAFLAQSPQLYKQMMVGIFERVFEVGPVFRAEKHATSRHLNEYVSLDLEFGFIEDHTTVMAMLRDVVAGIVDHLAEHRSRELELLEVKLPDVPEEIPALDFEEAKEILNERYPEVAGPPSDLSSREEECLGDWAREEHGSEFVFVTGYPMEKRPFYTHPGGEEIGSNSFDLLFRGLELVTGGQRLHRYEDYMQAFEEYGMSPEPFAAYLEAMKFGMPPHGGFAIGLERLLRQLTGESNIKATTLFPRDMHRIVP